MVPPKALGRPSKIKESQPDTVAAARLSYRQVVQLELGLAKIAGVARLGPESRQILLRELVERLPHTLVAAQISPERKIKTRGPKPKLRLVTVLSDCGIAFGSATSKQPKLWGRQGRESVVCEVARLAIQIVTASKSPFDGSLHSYFAAAHEIMAAPPSSVFASIETWPSPKWVVYGSAVHPSGARPRACYFEGRSLAEAQEWAAAPVCEGWTFTAAIVQLDRGRDKSGERRVVERLNSGKAWWE